MYTIKDPDNLNDQKKKYNIIMSKYFTSIKSNKIIPSSSENINLYDPGNTNTWEDVVWAEELSLFVAVSDSGVGNRVMTSPDGINWTQRTSASDDEWQGICWDANINGGLLVACAQSGTNRIMTSPDGITWSSRTPTAANFQAVASDGTIFVAVSDNGSVNAVASSTNGVTWIDRSTGSHRLIDVIYANTLDLFVAVDRNGVSNNVVTSPDGITWTDRTGANSNQYRGIAWSEDLGLLVAVASSGTGNRVMTSTNGTSWTERTSAADSAWERVIWIDNEFIAISSSTAEIMRSSDGINWVLTSTKENNAWFGLAYSSSLDITVCVGQSNTNRVFILKKDFINSTTNISITGNITCGINLNVIGDIESNGIVTAEDLNIGRYGMGIRKNTTPQGLIFDVANPNASLLISSIDNEIYMTGADSTNGFGIDDNSNNIYTYINDSAVISTNDIGIYNNIPLYSEFDTYLLKPGISFSNTTTYPSGINSLGAKKISIISNSNPKLNITDDLIKVHSIPQPFLYYDFSGNNILTAYFVDKSGNGFDPNVEEKTGLTFLEYLDREALYFTQTGTGTPTQYAQITSGTKLAEFAALTNFSISVWVNFTDTNIFNSIVSFSNTAVASTDFSIFSNAGIIHFRLVNNGSTIFDIISVQTINDGNWHNITVVSGTDRGAEIWLNNIIRDSDASTASLSSFTFNTITFGGNQDSVGLERAYNGYISELAMYPRTLSTDEMTGIYSYFSISNTSITTNIDLDMLANIRLPTTGGTASNLSYYEVYSASFSFSGSGVSTSGTIKITRIGNMCVLQTPKMTGTGNNTANSISSTTNLPARFIPSATETIYSGGHICGNNGTSGAGFWFAINQSGTMSFAVIGGTNWNGSVALFIGSISYLV